MSDKALFEIKVDAKIELHHHHHGEQGQHGEILRKLNQLDADVKKLVDSSASLNSKERALLQRLVDDLTKMGKPD